MWSRCNTTAQAAMTLVVGQLCLDVLSIKRESWSSIGDAEMNSDVASGTPIVASGTLMNQWKPKQAQWEHVIQINDMSDQFFNITLWVLIQGRILTA